MTTFNFWLTDYKELFNNIYLFPNKNMTRNQLLNSLTRYSLIIFLLFYFINSKHYWYYIPLFIFIGSILLFLLDLNKHKDDKIDEDKKKITCRKPNINNPYMNVLVTQDKVQLPACDSRDENIKSKTDEFYKFNLYQNANDLFETKNLERQFYTMPSTTIPNKQNEFINWLYKNESNCKINTEMCLPFEDKRYH